MPSITRDSPQVSHSENPVNVNGARNEHPADNKLETEKGVDETPNKSNQTKTKPQSQDELDSTVDIDIALKQLVQDFESRGERLLAHIFEQSKISLEGHKVIIWLPTGFKNESVEEAKYKVNHFLVKALKNEDIVVQYEELKTEFKPDIPYAFQDKLEDMVAKNSDITLWFEKLKLKQN